MNELEELKQQIEELKKSNEVLSKERDRYKEWWLNVDSQNKELRQSLKAISTLANIVCKSN